MGGSSLGPAVLASTFGKTPDCPQLYMLDSTVPEQIAAVESKIDISKTIFIVSSKSGSTLEPNILKNYFFEKVKDQLGEQLAAQHFIAITDPNSQLEKTAQKEGFRYIFHGVPSIGGRYSILSAFGMVPAAVMGIDLVRFLQRAKLMEQACTISKPIASNPGAILGLIIGLLANQGNNKITFVLSPKIASFGAWLEQLLAESTGKDGKGLIPINGENLDKVSHYGSDRLFIYICLAGNTEPRQEKWINEIEARGLPVVNIELSDEYDLAQEFFRFEFATAIAGSIMGINPFDQPDVEASKIATGNITSEYEKTGILQLSAPVYVETMGKDSIEFFTDASNWELITKNIKGPLSATEILKGLLAQVQKDDYVAILAYLEMNQKNETLLQNIRDIIHIELKTATCLGFGPRYLHSTGQVYKGGPNTGIFIEITADDSVDLPVPGKKYTFGLVKTAQAIGDFQILCQRERRALRIHLKGELSSSLSVLLKHVAEACRAIK